LKPLAHTYMTTSINSGEVRQKYNIHSHIITNDDRNKQYDYDEFSDILTHYIKLITECRIACDTAIASNEFDPSSAELDTLLP
jgi:hypothetical protein